MIRENEEAVDEGDERKELKGRKSVLGGREVEGSEE